jgi:hypothetical protein
MTTTVISTATPPLAILDQIAGMRFGLHVNLKVRPGLAAACRTETSVCGEGFRIAMWGPELIQQVTKVNMKKNEKMNDKKIEKKILPFPALREPEITSMTFQIGKDRFIIHWEIENLPPVVKPPLLLKTPPRKAKRIP